MPTRVKKNKKGCFPPPRIGSAGLWRSITVINFHHHPRTDKRKSNKSPDQFSSQEYIKNTILILIPRTKNTRTNWIELDQPINITIHTSRTLVASLFTNQQLIQNSSTRLSLSSSHDRRWSGVAKSRVTRSTSSSMVVVIFCPRGGGGRLPVFPLPLPTHQISCPSSPDDENTGERRRRQKRHRGNDNGAKPGLDKGKATWRWVSSASELQWACCHPSYEPHAPLLQPAESISGKAGIGRSDILGLLSSECGSGSGMPGVG